MTVRRGRYFRSTALSGGRRRVTAKTLPLHFESTIDSGDFDTPVDYTPGRIVPADAHPLLSDGWYITSGQVRYALGIPAAGQMSGQDGVVGIGGRKGQNNFAMRLLRFGHVHWPTRTFVDVGGAPDYDRANLSQSQTTENVQGTDYVIANTVTWTDLWSTPNGGAVSAQWQFNDDQEKEEVTVDELANTWVMANRWLPFVQSTVPAATLNDTFFGQVFRLDWSNIPRAVIDDVLQNLDNDIEITNDTLQLQDSIQRPLAFLPISELQVRRSPPDGTVRQRLRRRIWLDGDGNHYLLVGLSLADLEALPTGDWVYDPPVNQASEAYGTEVEGFGWSTTPIYYWEETGAGREVPAASFDVSGENIPQDSTCSSATYEFTRLSDISGTTCTQEMGTQTGSNPAIVGPSNLPETDWTIQGTAEDWDIPTGTSGTVQSDDTGNLAAAIETNMGLGSIQRINVRAFPANDVGDFQQGTTGATAATLDFVYTPPGGLHDLIDGGLISGGLIDKGLIH